MKRLLVAVLVLAGCASQTPPQERPLPPGMVAIANFTAEADPVAGTFTIRTEPTAAGRASGMRSLLDSEVLVENAAAPWFDSADPHGCPAGTRTWGANVRVTSLLGETIWLGGVYAEITSFSGPSGSEGCNSSEAPEGLSADYGLWEYPTIAELEPGPQTVPWSFGWVSTTEFTFSGRIVAAKVTMSDVLDFAVDGDQVIGDTGTRMVYASAEFDGLQFVNYDGTDAGVSSPIGELATSIAPDVGEGLIWATTAGEEVGFVLNDGSGAAFTAGGGGYLGGIVPDPSVAGRAWFRSNENKFIRSVDRTGLTLGAPVSTGSYAPWGMAIGPEGYLYVTAISENRILVYTTGPTGGTPVINFATGGDCSGPRAIIQGPDGKMWFGAEDSDAVCSFTPGYDPANPPVPARVNPAGSPIEGPSQLAIGPDGNVWVGANDTSQVVRVDATGPGYRISLPSLYGAFGVATADGKLWAADVYGIYPIELDPLTP